MTRVYRLLTTAACIQIVLSASWAIAEDAQPADKMEKVTYQDHVLPLLRSKCAACHSADQAKGGLVVDSYSAIMQGGGSGEVVVPGDLEGSRLWAVVAHLEEPFMPPKEPKLPDAQLAVLKKWIELGAPENSGSKVKIKKPAFSLGTATISGERPEGPPIMPENISTEPVVLSPRGNAATAMAVAPWAPLMAVGGHRQVLLYNTQTLRLAAVFPFPEGIPYVLKFSRNGGLLLAGGGRGGQSGRVIVWDVKTGQRAFEVGAEYDAVLAADISADNSQIALGGPRKMVRVYSTKDGELMYEIKKHTDWITSLEFSPDGVLLATGDRSNGLFVWEAFTGREFYNLAAHTAAISGISWRLDSNIVASTSEDGTIKLWEMTNGTNVKNWGAHGGGSAAVQFTRDGRLLSTGRDRVTKLWDQNGGQLRAFPAHNDLGLEVAFCSETDRAFAGDWTGAIRNWEAKDGAELAALLSNPPALAVRIDEAAKRAAAAAAASQQAAANLAALQKVEADLKTTADAAAKAAVDGDAAAKAAEAAKVAADKVLADTTAAATAAETALATAKAAQEVATVAKTEADKGTDQAVKDQAAANLKTATDATVAAQAAFDTAAAAKEAAAKEVAAAAEKQKVAVEQAAALKVAAEKATAAAVITPERQKALTDADAAAKAAAGVAAQEQAYVDSLNAEKARAGATAAATPAPAPAPAQ